MAKPSSLTNGTQAGRTKPPTVNLEMADSSSEFDLRSSVLSYSENVGEDNVGFLPDTSVNLNPEPGSAPVLGTPIEDPPIKKGNIYMRKKHFAQGMLDIALLSANVSQLKSLLHEGKNVHHVFFYPDLGMLILSLILQITVGLCIILLTQEKVKARAKKLNNAITILVFAITVLNVLISALGVA